MRPSEALHRELLSQIAVLVAEVPPKSVQARYSGAPGVTSLVEISLSFTPNKATGAKNDASISRYAAVMRAVRRLGIHLVDGPQIYSNQLPDLSAIDHAVTELSKTPPAQLNREIAEVLRHKKRQS
jgi:hypothetical protein